MSQKEDDVRECTLAACHRIGLYPDLQDPSSDAWLDRPCIELVVAAMTDCDHLGPPYNDILMTFRQAYRGCLKAKGYKKIRVFLQRLCTGDWTWRDWSRYHSRHVRLSKSL